MPPDDTDKANARPGLIPAGRSTKQEERYNMSKLPPAGERNKVPINSLLPARVRESFDRMRASAIAAGSGAIRLQ